MRVGMASLNTRITKLLRRQKRLLVHFNTPMSRHSLGYPHDLQDALANPHWALCLSTLQASDLPPSLHGNPSNAPVQGHIGLVMGLTGGRLIAVKASDQGSSGRTHVPSGRATVAECRNALKAKVTTDEWFGAGLKPLAIFTFATPYGFRPGQGEVRVQLTQVLSDFPDMPVISTHDGQFWLFNRAKMQFDPTPYGALPLS